MIFSYNWLQSFFKRKLPKPEKLAELLTMHSFEVIEVEKFGNDFVLNIDVLANRPDCFSHLGIAREISVILNYKLEIPETKLNEEKKLKAKDFAKVRVEDKNACPRYAARIILDVKLEPSPKFVQERLRACGLKPINNIVDISNYVMLETGQPLHAFDLEKIKGKKIIVRFAKKGEEILTLDNQKFDLDENILVIADETDPLVIAGIKGGKRAEIDENTRNIVVESANFDRIVIRKGSQKFNLKTDASLRFEHGLDPNLVKFGLDRVAKLIKEIAGGKITNGVIDFYPEKVLSKKIKLDLDYLERLLGIKIPVKEIKNIFQKLGFKISQSLSHPITRALIVEIPTFRQDILLPEDLIEEVGRILGYNKIPSILPLTILIPPKKNLDIFWEDMAKDILKEAGFTEVYNFSFISEKEAIFFDYEKNDLIEVENPTSLDFQYLRPSLIPNLLKNSQKNQENLQDIKIFELGKIFKIENSKLIEKKMLSGLMTGNFFFGAKGVCDSLLNKLGISQVFYDEYKPTPEESKISIWHSKKIAEIKIDDQEIGFLGVVSRRILEKFEISQSLVLFDIDFEKLQRYASEEHEYQPISRYPAAVRDIAILVPKTTKVEEVLNKIEEVSPLIRDVDLFDIYEGEEIPEGKKNLAFHIIYQAEDRTLSSPEIEEIKAKIIEVLERDPEWEVRR